MREKEKEEEEDDLVRLPMNARAQMFLFIIYYFLYFQEANDAAQIFGRVVSYDNVFFY